VNPVSPTFFASLGVTISAGRGFVDGDADASPEVAILSQSLVADGWNGVPPIGECVSLSGEDSGCTEIIGVASDANFEGVAGDPSAVLYVPLDSGPGSAGRATVFLRTRGDPAEMISPIRSAIAALDPTLPFLRIETLDARVRPLIIPWEVGTKLFVALGVLAATLAAVGLYMVVSFSASQRLRELGIRSALGAGRNSLLGLVLLDGVKVASLGLLAGVVIAISAGALLRNQFFGLTYTDVPTYAGVALAMMVVAVGASIRPAMRAAQADPAVVLRGD